jgi:hypothetical protein
MTHHVVVYHGQRPRRWPHARPGVAKALRNDAGDGTPGARTLGPRYTPLLDQPGGACRLCGGRRAHPGDVRGDGGGHAGDLRQARPDDPQAHLVLHESHLGRGTRGSGLYRVGRLIAACGRRLRPKSENTYFYVCPLLLQVKVGSEALATVRLVKSPSAC